MAVNYYNYVLARRQEAQRRKIFRRNIRDSYNPFELPDREFQRIFRLTKPMVVYLCEEMRVDLQPINEVDGLPVHIKVLTCIHHLGDGSYQRPTGQDHTLCLAQTTVSKYLAQFLDAVIRVLMPQWVYFPSNEPERQRISEDFRDQFGVPDVVGAIDCTHIAIFPPSGLQGIQFKNRKQFYSINTQLICNADCRILHVNARFPGRVHDQFIFNNSNIRNHMRRLYEGRIGSYYLLGDSGYALEPWLMTPVLDAPPNSPSERYTQWHCRVRNCIERTNGYLKGTFRLLGHDRKLHYKPAKASKIIYACVTLYNIMLHYRVPFEEVPFNPQEVVPVNPEVEYNVPGRRAGAAVLRVAQAKREHIINTHFTYSSFFLQPILLSHNVIPFCHQITEPLKRKKT